MATPVVLDAVVSLVSQRHISGVDATHGSSLGPASIFEIDNQVKPFVIPILGLAIGAAMMQVKSVATAGKLVLYFGAQSFMNIFMGWVLGSHVTVPAGTELTHPNGTAFTLEENLCGCPAGFALTALQQIVSFVVFMIGFAALYPTPYRYTPKSLDTNYEKMCVVIFGCVFALNIALNNFSLGYISIAVNLIIRSCLPLTTFLSQQTLAQFKMYPLQPCRAMEIALMVFGVICAAVFTIAQIMGSSSGGKNGSNDVASMILGSVVCILSLLCGSLNLALAGVLGSSAKLNVYDTVAYMAVPATVFLLPIAMFIQKPVPGSWPVVFGKDTMSDWEILMGVWSINKTTIAYLFLSGIFSFAYNIVQFSIVHTLSPSATAFGGNFNKAALIFMTLLLPFLQTKPNPPAPYIYVIWGAVICNIAAFSYYSHLQMQAKEQAKEKTTKVAPLAMEEGESKDKPAE